MSQIIEFADERTKAHLEGSDFESVIAVEPNFADFADWQNVCAAVAKDGNLDARNLWVAVKAVARKDNGDTLFATKADFDNSPGREAAALGAAAFNYLAEYARGLDADEKKAST